MRVLSAFLFFTVLAVVAAATFIWFVVRLFFKIDFKPGSKAWERLVQRLRSEVEPLASKLVPWDGEMLGLLSLNQTQKRKSGVFGQAQQGVFTTIYHEPAVVFASQTTKGTGLLLARTSNHEFIFRFKERETEIWLDKQPFGVMAEGVLLAPGKTARQLARLENNPGESHFFLTIGERPAATLADPANQDSPMPRALTLLRNLGPEEESIVLTLAVLEMVRGRKI